MVYRPTVISKRESDADFIYDAFTSLPKGYQKMCQEYLVYVAITYTQQETDQQIKVALAHTVHTDELKEMAHEIGHLGVNKYAGLCISTKPFDIFNYIVISIHSIRKAVELELTPNFTNFEDEVRFVFYHEVRHIGHHYAVLRPSEPTLISREPRMEYEADMFAFAIMRSRLAAERIYLWGTG